MSEALINLLSGNIGGNIESIDVLVERRPGIQTNVNLFSSLCNSLDTQIVAIAASIVNIQTEIVNLSTSAYAVGCGTTAGASTIYPDTVRSYSYNLCNESYDGDAPYDVTVSFLNSGNVGFGTFLVYTQNDITQTGIGSLYGSIGNCFRTPCTSGNCVAFASSITEKQNQLTTLRGQLVGIVTSSKQLKREREEYEIERYGTNYTIRILREENIRISAAITTVQNYS
jgi:hypothetical protein